MPNALTSERIIVLDGTQVNLDLFQGPNFVAGLVYKIKLRNKLISIIDEIVSSNTCYKSINFQEELQKLLVFEKLRRNKFENRIIFQWP